MNCAKSELQITFNKIFLKWYMDNGKEFLIVRKKISRFGQVNLFAISFKCGNY